MSTRGGSTNSCSRVWARRREHRGHHFRLPAQCLRVRSHSPPCGSGGPRRCRHRQYLRGHRGSRAPGPPGDPPGKARAARRPRSSSPAAPRRLPPRALPPCPKSIASSATTPRWNATTWIGRARGVARTRLRHRRRREDRRQRHHVGDGDGGASDRGHRGARTRLCAGAERLRPSLHLLRHSLWPRQFALGADGRGRGAGPPPRRQRLSRGRVDRRRSHELWRRPAGRARGSAHWCARF